jgi:WD40 repeat protein
MYTTDSTFFIHDLTNDTNLLRFEYEGRSRSAISSDGSCIATFSDTFSHVWSPVLSLTFSSDTTLLAVETFSRTHIWNIRCHAFISTIAPIIGHTIFQFSPDNTQLVSLVSYGMLINPHHLKLWDVETGDCLASIQLTGDFDRVSFGADGTSVILDSKITQTRERWSISLRARDISTDNNHNDDHSPLPMMFVLVHHTQQPTSPDVPSQQVYYKRMDEWVLDNQKRRVCWLLPDLRGRKYNVHGGKVVIGCQNGRVVIVDISDVR